MKRCLFTILVILLTLAAVAITGYQTYTEGKWRFVTPNPATYPVMGIDVSHHQGTIDWPTAAASGNIRFAFIKATEGGDHQDRLFAANWQGATHTNLPAAPYHFFTLCRKGSEQAANFLAATQNISTTLPVVVDLEYVGNCKARPAPEAVATELHDFLHAIRNRFPQPALLYTTSHFRSDYLMQGFEQNPVWIRSVFTKPNENLHWTFWQFADSARLAGITGPVDLNVFSGGEEEWQAYLQSFATPAEE